TASTSGEIDLAGTITGNTQLTLSDASSVLDIAAVTGLSGTTLTAANAAVWSLPSTWHPILGTGVALTTTGSGSQIMNHGTLGISSGQLSINTSDFVNQGVLDAQNAGTIAINGSFRIDDPGILKGASGGNLNVTGDLLGNTHSAQL